MSPQEFAALWNEPLTKASSSALTEMPFSSETKTWLVEVGLPKDAAPFLSFRLKDGLIATAEQWPSRQVSNGLWSIGSNGSGDPICIKENEEIVYLNHDNRFQEIFINSSVKRLVECLLIFRQMIEELDEGYLSENIPEEWKQRTKKLLFDADNALAVRENFWSDELADLE